MKWPHPHHLCPVCEGVVVKSDKTGFTTCVLCGSLVETDYEAMKGCKDCGPPR